MIYLPPSFTCSFIGDEYFSGGGGVQNITTPFRIWDKNIIKLRQGSPFLKYNEIKEGGGRKNGTVMKYWEPPNCSITINLYFFRKVLIQIMLYNYSYSQKKPKKNEDEEGGQNITPQNSALCASVKPTVSFKCLHITTVLPTPLTMANQRPRYTAISPAAIFWINHVLLSTILRTFNILYNGITDGINNHVKIYKVPGITGTNTFKPFHIYVCVSE